MADARAEARREGLARRELLGQHDQLDEDEDAVEGDQESAAETPRPAAPQEQGERGDTHYDQPDQVEDR